MLHLDLTVLQRNVILILNLVDLALLRTAEILLLLTKDQVLDLATSHHQLKLYLLKTLHRHLHE